jgi:hypothetical protein
MELQELLPSSLSPEAEVIPPLELLRPLTRGVTGGVHWTREDHRQLEGEALDQSLPVVDGDAI